MGGFGNGGWKDARGWLYIHIGFGGVWDYRAVEKIGQEQHMNRKKWKRGCRGRECRTIEGWKKKGVGRRTAQKSYVLECVRMESACGWACMFRYWVFCLCAVWSDVDFFCLICMCGYCVDLISWDMCGIIYGGFISFMGTWQSQRGRKYVLVVVYWIHVWSRDRKSVV